MKSDSIFPDISEANRECAHTVHYYTPGGAKITETHQLNRDRAVAVATDVFWNEDMATAPRGTKCQLLGAGGVATYGVYNGRDPFWVAWAPCPKRRPTASARTQPDQP